MGGVLVGSALLLLALNILLPAIALPLLLIWFAVHVTYSDDWARHAVVLLYNLQVQPVVDAFRLTPIAADLETAEYWWWFAQGLLLVVLVRYLAGSDKEDEAVGEDSEEMKEVVVGGGRPIWETEALMGPLNKLAHGSPRQSFTTITIEEIG